VVEILKQPQYRPLPVEEQVLSIYAVTEGYLDDVDVDEVARFERELRETFRSRYSAMLAKIRETGALPDGDSFDAAVAEFASSFESSKEEETV
jgi:F-type H+-transporting ATPase subunit alpha